MTNQLGVTGISVHEFARKRANGEQMTILDVREFHELAKANLGQDVVVVPLSTIARRQEEALPGSLLENKKAKIIVMCHHGIRSAQVVAWMQDNQFQNVWNLDGGIEAYAVEIDAMIGRY